MASFSADQLLKSLQVVINNLLASTQPHDDNEVFSRELCFLIERFMNDGLRRGFFGGPPPFWQFVENLTQCLPGAINLLNIIRNAAKTPVSRGRVFLRLSLNEGSLTEYLNALIWNKDLVNQYYEPTAFLRQEENISAAMLQLDSVCRLKFSFAWRGRNYDDAFYGEEVLTAKVEALLKTSQQQQQQQQQQSQQPSPSNSSTNTTTIGPSTSSNSVGSNTSGGGGSSTTNVSQLETPVVPKIEVITADPKKENTISAAAYNDNLLNELKKSIQQMVMESGNERAVYDHFDSLKVFLGILNRLLSNALKLSMFGGTTWWEYVRNISEKVPGADDVINRINSSETLDTPQLKMAAFLRLSLNENSLAHFLNALTWDVPLTDKYYSKDSILKNDEQMAILVDLLESVSALRFCLKVDEEVSSSSASSSSKVASPLKTPPPPTHQTLHAAQKKKGPKRMVTLDNDTPLSPPSPALVATQIASDLHSMGTALDTVVAILPPTNSTVIMTSSLPQVTSSSERSAPETAAESTSTAKATATQVPLVMTSATQVMTSSSVAPSSEELVSPRLTSTISPPLLTTEMHHRSRSPRLPPSGRSSHDLVAALDFLTTVDTNHITERRE